MSYPALPADPSFEIPLFLSAFDPSFFFDALLPQNVSTQLAAGASPMFQHGKGFSPELILSSYVVQQDVSRIGARPLRWGLKRGFIMFQPGGALPT